MPVLDNRTKILDKLQDELRADRKICSVFPPQTASRSFPGPLPAINSRTHITYQLSLSVIADSVFISTFIDIVVPLK